MDQFICAGLRKVERDCMHFTVFSNFHIDLQVFFCLQYAKQLVYDLIAEKEMQVRTTKII